MLLLPALAQVTIVAVLIVIARTAELARSLPRSGFAVATIAAASLPSRPLSLALAALVPSPPHFAIAPHRWPLRRGVRS